LSVCSSAFYGPSCLKIKGFNDPNYVGWVIVVGLRANSIHLLIPWPAKCRSGRKLQTADCLHHIIL